MLLDNPKMIGEDHGNSAPEFPQNINEQVQDLNAMLKKTNRRLERSMERKNYRMISNSMRASICRISSLHSKAPNK